MRSLVTGGRLKSGGGNHTSTLCPLCPLLPSALFPSHTNKMFYTVRLVNLCKSEQARLARKASAFTRAHHRRVAAAGLLCSVGLPLLCLVCLAAATPAQNILVAYCYSRLPCEGGTPGQIWWDPHNFEYHRQDTCFRAVQKLIQAASLSQ